MTKHSSVSPKRRDISPRLKTSCHGSARNASRMGEIMRAKADAYVERNNAVTPFNN
jgi:hypothetical protein